MCKKKKKAGEWKLGTMLTYELQLESNSQDYCAELSYLIFLIWRICRQVNRVLKKLCRVTMKASIHSLL